MHERFFAKVRITPGCWLWLGATDRKGYGRFSIGPSRDIHGRRRNSMRGAHQVSFEMHGGTYEKGPCVLHRCDRPECVNPAHLFAGTLLDNVRDMDSKGRRVTRAHRGSAHPNSVLSEAAVLQIASRIRLGETQRALADEFGVCLATINHINTGRLWAHLTRPAA